MPEPAPSDSARPERPAAPKRQLTLFDSSCIIVGIIIGAGIYKSSPSIAGFVDGAGMGSPGLIGVWLLGGLFSLLGALCYAELATAYPREGGDYVYLTRAFGRAPGFLFAWSQLWVIRPGSIGAMAYVFASYADELAPLSSKVTSWCEAWYAARESIPESWPSAGTVGQSAALVIYAAAPVIVLTGINVLGVREGKWTQNLLTTIKVLGLVAIVAVGLWFAAFAAPPEPASETGKAAVSEAAAAPQAGQDAAEASAEKPKPSKWSFFGLAMIFVLFTYGGWNEMAYVGAEVHNPKKNILRALVLGTVAVTLIYVLVTWAFLRALGFEGLCKSQAPATDVLKSGLEGIRPGWERGAALAGGAISLLICISALGAINGQIFTGARIYYAMGTDHRLYAWLGRWSQRFGTPVWSLVFQAVLTLALVMAFGWLVIIGRAKGGFESMVIFTSPVFWFFLAMVGISVAELRDREPDTPRPYRVQAYPVIPILFCASCLFMLWSSLTYAVENRSWEAFWSVLILLVGVAMCFWDPRPRGQPELPPEPD